jgi:hypothetical protein
MKTGSGFDECCCFGFGVLLSHWMDESKCQLEMLADGVIEGLIWGSAEAEIAEIVERS